MEASPDEFTFWVARELLVERNQLVETESAVGNMPVRFYGVVTDVHRRSRKRDLADAFDETDGEPAEDPAFVGDGITYATVSVLATTPPRLAPPLEGSPVHLAGDSAADRAFGFDAIGDGARLDVGLVRNGADGTAGRAALDLDYLLGQNGGHLLVNGKSGKATKSSFLLHVVYLLLRLARQRQADAPGDADALQVVPVVFNVKGTDLLYLDHPHRAYDAETHAPRGAVGGGDDPGPFEGVDYFGPQMPDADVARPNGRPGTTRPYSWALADVVERGLLPFLFADDESANDNFVTLLLDIEARLTRETTAGDGATRLALDPDGPAATFRDLLDWVRDQAALPDGERALRNHATGTWRKLARKLFRLLTDGRGVLRWDDERGHPLDTRGHATDDSHPLAATLTRAPVVVDLEPLATTPAIQRFVVATVLNGLVAAHGAPGGGLVHLVVIDELNRFAPRRASDPVTRLVETVAAELRSRGVILLGAQQQASRVSERVVENASTLVLGATGPLELRQTVWSALSEAAKKRAPRLGPDEKLVLQDTTPEPVHVRVPFPPWATSRRDAAADPTGPGAPPPPAEF
jgi:DNA helicase HerA-like ATPase